MRVCLEAVSIVCPGVGTLLSRRGCRASWEKAQLFIIFIDPCVPSRWSLGLGELRFPRLCEWGWVGCRWSSWPPTGRACRWGIYVPRAEELGGCQGCTGQGLCPASWLASVIVERGSAPPSSLKSTMLLSPSCSCDSRLCAPYKKAKQDKRRCSHPERSPLGAVVCGLGPAGLPAPDR